MCDVCSILGSFDDLEMRETFVQKRQLIVEHFINSFTRHEIVKLRYPAKVDKQLSWEVLSAFFALYLLYFTGYL